MSEQPPVEQATAAPGEQRDTGRPSNLPPRVNDPQPLPNRADEAFAELEALQREARDLELEVTGREPLAELRAKVEAARG